MAARQITEGIWCGDCGRLLRQVPDGVIDLCLTSPPYADLRSYGPRGVSIPPDGYVDWLIPKAWEIHRVLSPSGSFVLNINDRVVRRERHLYVFDLVVALKRIVGFHLFEVIIWDKGKLLPHPRRFGDVFEYVFWFTKTGHFTLNLDAVRQPYSPASLARMKYDLAKRWTREQSKDLSIRKDWGPNPAGGLPKNLIRMFNTNRHSTEHTAVFPEEFARFFILAGSNPGDLVLDPFLGSGTAAVVAAKLGRRYLGIDVVARYCRTARARVRAAATSAAPQADEQRRHPRRSCKSPPLTSGTPAKNGRNSLTGQQCGV